jgi:hypothetical protein
VHPGPDSTGHPIFIYYYGTAKNWLMMCFLSFSAMLLTLKSKNTMIVSTDSLYILANEKWCDLSDCATVRRCSFLFSVIILYVNYLFINTDGFMKVYFILLKNTFIIPT